MFEIESPPAKEETFVDLESKDEHWGIDETIENYDTEDEDDYGCPENDVRERYSS